MSQSRQMARLTKELAQASDFRKAAIDAMREATKSALAACAAARGDMARDYRAQMHAFLSSLSRQVAGHRRAMAHQIAQTQKRLADAAKNVAAQRNAAMNEIARMASARGRAASRLRDRLQHEVEAIAIRTEALRGAAADAVAGLAKTHRAMARRQRAELKSGRRRLQAATAKFVDALHADRMKAQAIWSDFAFGRAA